MKVLYILLLLTIISGCVSTASKQAEAKNHQVQKHDLFDGDINATTITKENMSAANSGTRFDQVDTSKLNGQQLKSLKKNNFVTRGDAALSARNLDFALYAYVRALVEDPQDKNLYYKIGTIHESRSNTSLAFLAYQKALTLDPNYVSALERMGRLKLHDRDYNEAKQLFEHAISEDSKGFVSEENTRHFNQDSPFHAFIGLGVIHDLNFNHEAAREHFSRAIEIQPTSASAENNLGYSYYLAQDLDLAQKHFKLAISKDKGYSKAWTNLALVHVRQEKFVAAINLLINHTNNKPSAYNTVGYICMLEGKYEQAEEYFNEAIDLSPTYFEIAVENRDLNRRRYSASVYQALN